MAFQRRRRSVLVVLVLALVLALVPHPRHQGRGEEDLPQQRFLAVAQESHHGHFPFSQALKRHARDARKARDAQEAENAAAEELEARLAEAEDSSVSLTLLGCMGFVMATFYLVNWPDDDIRQISLEVLNSTISIFGALLLFHTFEDVLEHYILPEMSHWQEVAVSMLQMLLWFVALQLVLAYYSGALGKNQAVMLRSDSLSVAKACESPTTKWHLMKSADQHLGVIKLNTEAWGILLGHATGFAAKNACSSLQQAVPRNFFFVALTPLLFFGIIILVYHATECFRYKIMMRDGEEDEFEEIWRERVAETEDEVIALAVSFSIVQMLRFGISGHLPNASGEDQERFNLHTNSSCALLLLVGLVPGVADVVRVMCTRSANTFVRIVSGRGSEEERLRSRNWCEGISSMSFAWCIHFAVDWWIASNFELEGSMKAVLSALTVTALAFVLIFGLDKVADSNFDDVEVHHALRGMIGGLGLLVGFSWERCFDASFDGLAKHRHFGPVPPEISRVVLAIALALLVLPAWKWFILPMPHGPHGSHGVDDHTPKIPRGEVKDEAQTSSKHRQARPLSQPDRFSLRPIGSFFSSLGIFPELHATKMLPFSPSPRSGVFSLHRQQKLPIWVDSLGSWVARPIATSM